VTQLYAIPFEPLPPPAPAYADGANAQRPHSLGSSLVRATNREPATDNWFSSYPVALKVHSPSDGASQQ
jgi:hypothetical protein